LKPVILFLWKNHGLPALLPQRRVSHQLFANEEIRSLKKYAPFSSDLIFIIGDTSFSMYKLPRPLFS
jgi:hypothetical protein